MSFLGGIPFLGCFCDRAEVVSPDSRLENLISLHPGEGATKIFSNILFLCSYSQHEAIHPL